MLEMAKELMGIMSDGWRLILTLLVIIVAGTVLDIRLISPKIDPREPPVVYAKVPLIGHIIGMMRQGPHYLKNLRYVRSALLTLTLL